MDNETKIQESANTSTKSKSNGKKKSKKLVSSSDFSRVAAVATVIKSNGYADAEKVVTLADKLYKEKTGTPLNPKETKANFLFAVRFLKAYEAK